MYERRGVVRLSFWYHHVPTLYSFRVAMLGTKRRKQEAADAEPVEDAHMTSVESTQEHLGSRNSLRGGGITLEATRGGGGVVGFDATGWRLLDPLTLHMPAGLQKSRHD